MMETSLFQISIFVEDGTTHMVLHLDNETYSWVETTPKDVVTSQWNELMATESTQNVIIRIENSMF